MPADLHTAMNNLIWMDKGRMSGELFFRNTRVPFPTLLDHPDLEDFLQNFPSVARDQAILFVKFAKTAIFAQVDPSA